MAKQQKFRFAVPPGTTPTERLRIGMDVITYIQRRAIERHQGFRKGKGKVPGREFMFPKYTKKYAKKKRTSIHAVDLVLSADMFNAMDVLQNRADGVTIGFRPGKQNDKAEGNQIGSYGKPKGNQKKARPFLGLPKIALQRIIEKVRGKDADVSETTTE